MTAFPPIRSAEKRSQRSRLPAFLGTGEVDASEIGIGEVDTGKIGTGEVGTGEIGIA